MTFNRQQIQSAYRNLSKEAQSFVISTDTAELIDSTIKELGLTQEQTTVADGEIFNAMLGLQTLDNAIENISESSKRPADELANLKSNLKSNIFINIPQIPVREEKIQPARQDLVDPKEGDNLEETKIEALETARARLEEIKKEAGEARKRVREKAEIMAETYDAQKEALRATEVKPASEIRKERFAKAVEKSSWAKFRGYNYDAASQIRKGKSKKEQLAEAAAALAKEEAEASGEAETPPTTPPPTPPVTPPSTPSAGGATGS
ncbi:MAG: hypothetical protein A2544_01865 [Candidatus Zambryskibacteria bacterium RIFOXYD2_FULL_43_10]|uniref:Uncharacterized protein n=1 Tax=Candidatus Zambryskibacteria bacterium RIFOXYD2_FULL_43_10 TaxID=1802782 RepID=A0A1G2V830_9BACT|nr:MAG: hypothetical protein A2544_01865 [Candidatus Zambryskibacteria bacterium RIFOXYD2_FULL_43_10]